MASPENAVVLRLLREQPLFRGQSLAELRAEFETLTAATPVPDGLAVEPIDAGGVPAEWLLAPGIGGDGVLLYLHGGGYVIGSMRSHRSLAGTIGMGAGVRVLIPAYRLAPEHPFPAAVDDAVAAYRFLLGRGVPAARIVVAGDSAGGGLTVALLLALRDAGVALPAGAVLLSPWLDLSLSGASMTTRAALDPMIQRDGGAALAAAYLAGTDPRTPLASPLFGDLTGLPPLLVQVGTSETLYDDSTRFADRARAAGVDVALESWDEMVHVWQAFHPMLPEAREAIAHVAAFVRDRLDLR